MKNNRYMALAAAIAAGLSANAPPITIDPSTLPFRASSRRAQATQRRRHLTKKGPGRVGHNGRGDQRKDREYADINGGYAMVPRRRTLRKLLGTRG